MQYYRKTEITSRFTAILLELPTLEVYFYKQGPKRNVRIFLQEFHKFRFLVLLWKGWAFEFLK
jgi:hypothetical protein